jgi:hypothetical protein
MSHCLFTPFWVRRTRKNAQPAGPSIAVDVTIARVASGPFDKASPRHATRSRTVSRSAPIDSQASLKTTWRTAYSGRERAATSGVVGRHDQVPERCDPRDPSERGLPV